MTLPTVLCRRGLVVVYADASLIAPSVRLVRLPIVS